MQRRIIVQLLMVALLIGLLLLPASPIRAEAGLCFKETGQCLTDRFRMYWEQNGGLAIFGFPITPAQNERNRDTGQMYLTQWFERARFELHPENVAPYDVLLGRLGEDRLIQQSNAWLTQGDLGVDTGACLSFQQTKRFVCDRGPGGTFRAGVGFKTYWLTHGLTDPRLDAYGRSLALFGLPLTDAFETTNANGDNVLAQIFERARFEYHEGNPDPYKVLLGLLGTELRTDPGDAWTIARSILPAQVSIYQPTYLPKGFEPGPLLVGVYNRGNDPSTSYDVVYVMPGANPSIGYGKNYLRLLSGLPSPEYRPQGPAESITVVGRTGLFYSAPQVAQFMVTWQEGVRTYTVLAFGDQLTRDEMLQMVRRLQPVSQ